MRTAKELADEFLLSHPCISNTALAELVSEIRAEMREEKDERIAQLERSNEFIVRCFDEREKALADAYTAKMELKAEREQLRERVAELEAKLPQACDIRGLWKKENIE